MSGSTVTPFLRLLKPPFDTVPWDEAINGNMDTIDAFIARYMAVPNYVGAWANSVQYISGQNVLDITDATIYQCLITHTSSAVPATFAGDRATYPTYWAATTNVITGGTGNTNLTISSATPLSAKAGDLWWDSVGGQLYILYNDGNSLQWVIANNQAGNVGEAPNDGNVYGRRNSAWTQVSAGNVGRNLLHNPLFNIQQRGGGSWTTTNAYTVDRWRLNFVLDTMNIGTGVNSDAVRTAIGDESVNAYLNGTVTGNAGAGAYTFINQPIEDVHRLAGKTVTFSLWAASSPAMKLGVNISQIFGSGGSPSAATNTNGVAIQLSTTWGTRYSVTLTVPSVVGKTLGTNNDHYTQLNLWFSAGATNATISGNIGVQSGAISIMGLQLEIGNTATPLEKPDPRYDLANCQRFYAVVPVNFLGYQAAGTGYGGQLGWPVTMRAAPSVNATGAIYTNCGAISGTSLSPTGGFIYATSVATGSVQFAATINASADL